MMLATKIMTKTNIKMLIRPAMQIPQTKNRARTLYHTTTLCLHSFLTLNLLITHKRPTALLFEEKANNSSKVPLVTLKIQPKPHSAKPAKPPSAPPPTKQKPLPSLVADYDWLPQQMPLFFIVDPHRIRSPFLICAVFNVLEAQNHGEQPQWKMDHTKEIKLTKKWYLLLIV